MATRMLHDLRLWSKTLTPSNKRSGCSMNLQRGQGRNQTWTTQPSLNVSTGCWAKPILSSSRTRTRQTSSISTRVFDDESGMESESNLVMKEINVVVANIDQFGPATNRFLDSPAASGIADFMFSEMHVKEQGLVKLMSEFALQGFHSSVSAAIQFELSQSGSCGCTATLFRSYLAISHPFGTIQPGGTGFDWSSMTLFLKGTQVMFVSVYLTCNTGIAGENLQKLSEIGSCVRNAGIPFIIAGDWNVPPSELLESSWPGRIKGEILLPCDLEVSCTSGRLIDYAVCHRSIVIIAKLHSFVEGPWKTHQALLLTLPRSPGRFFTRSLATSPMKFPPIDRNAGSSSWSECVHQSDSFHFRPPDRPLSSYLDPNPALSQKLALKYKRWSCASENFLLSKCEAEMSNQKRFLGRGSETNFRLIPVVQRIPPVEEHFVDQECRFWSRLLSAAC